MSDPFDLPAGHVQIAFCGGRSSAYMLHRVLEANGDLPDRVVVTFPNTGREMPESLGSVAECGQRFGVEIVWLEYTADPPLFERVGHNSTARNGEPFDELFAKKQMVPNVTNGSVALLQGLFGDA